MPILKCCRAAPSLPVQRQIWQCSTLPPIVVDVEAGLFTIGRCNRKVELAAAAAGWLLPETRFPARCPVPLAIQANGSDSLLASEAEGLPGGSAAACSVVLEDASGSRLACSRRCG